MFEFKLTVKTIVTMIAAAWAWFQSKKALWNYLIKIAAPVVKEAEEMAKDGIIDRAERKALVMCVIGQMEKDGKIKLNIITRFLIGKVVDRIARELPDFKVAAEARQMIESISKKKKGGKDNV